MTISKPFYLGKYAVTQGQWRAVVGSNPSHFKGDDLPVDRVSWHDCQEFCKKLSTKAGKTVRLPTEAEWEYACRAGTTTKYSFGDDDSLLGEYGWFSDNTGGINPQSLQRLRHHRCEPDRQQGRETTKEFVDKMIEKFEECGEKRT